MGDAAGRGCVTRAAQGHHRGRGARIPPPLEEPVKPLLWFVLLVAIVANVSLNFLVGQGGLNIALSIVSGVVVLASAAGLWMLRSPRES
ncbi:hypothetical protein [Streptomyces sp. NPDC059814]|uniref:hypothetical protein n=1 Tax=unclassified Streptomyces TaxID=2593676 RepID=UPI0036463F37